MIWAPKVVVYRDAHNRNWVWMGRDETHHYCLRLDYTYFDMSEEALIHLSQVKIGEEHLGWGEPVLVNRLATSSINEESCLNDALNLCHETLKDPLSVMVRDLL